MYTYHYGQAIDFWLHHVASGLFLRSFRDKSRVVSPFLFKKALDC